MRKPQLLVAALVLLAATSSLVYAKVVEYEWVVDYAWAAPDCVEKQVISINGEFPGPNIRSVAGDTVRVHVINRMPTEAVVIHWHGMLQTGTPWEDGAAYVSQCPIDPEDEYTYDFVTENAGTYFWHGHYGMQRAAGFYGQLIVDPPENFTEPFKYDGEHSIVLNDWWHASMIDQQLGLFSVPFRWVGEPQSLLIEGRGRYNCSLMAGGSACNATRESCKLHVMPVEAGKTYRLRIASVASLGSFNFILEGHNFTVVEADGHYVEPVTMSDIDVYSGESYSVLFTANADCSRNYWAGFNVRGRDPKTLTGLAVLQYVNTSGEPSTPAPVSPRWNDYAYSVAKARQYLARKEFIVPLPQRGPDRQIFLLNTQNRVNGRLKWALNNVSFVPTATPALAALKYNITVEAHGGHSSATPPDYFQEGYDIMKPPPYPETVQGSGVYELKGDQVVDIILQNACSLTANVSEVHPWHLHGHDFWILGYGDGVFNASKDYASLNYYNPPLRNTAPLFPFGWTVLRFVTDNPGVWPFHCHIESHFHMGMGVIFAESVDKLPDVPTDTMGCGATKFYRSP
ncbi:hypothetical protein AXG93_1670s1130 [Marchantia polymorpha subsp. ruderalis]|uniref:L-ascorbate oxidase n=1 Tax=Marchantia polymorpha subsp. ruderalis TaxID=1480154 RepID=A0A176WGR9_MARPO|nr:hypothetical protein AXG93_1670s1130 [Marchantia polymorpha subsp. ruderalis]